MQHQNLFADQESPPVRTTRPRVLPRDNSDWRQLSGKAVPPGAALSFVDKPSPASTKLPHDSGMPAKPVRQSRRHPPVGERARKIPRVSPWPPVTAAVHSKSVRNIFSQLRNY